MEDKVKVPRRRGTSRISAKHQVTIPVEALHKAGLQPGDRLRAQARGAGKIMLVREQDPIEAHAGSLTGVFDPDSLASLRAEWR
jgi:bifunctional DNA-binding transcriptional regulator/antitoxin component of YhaV-PrlF toxin-antitoxin module